MAIIEFYVFGILYLKSPTHWNNAGRGKESTDHAQYNWARTPSSTWYPSHVDCYQRQLTI